MRVEYSEPLAAWIFPVLGKVRIVAITVQNLIAVFANYSSLYLVFLCFLTLSCAIFAAINRQQ